MVMKAVEIISTPLEISNQAVEIPRKAREISNRAREMISIDRSEISRRLEIIWTLVEIISRPERSRIRASR